MSAASRARTMLAAGAASLALLTACAHDASTAPDGNAARHPWTQPGVLRLADVADPDSLNPLLSTMDLSYDLSWLIFSYLVIADARGTPVGDLATEVPSLANGGISHDGKTYTYHLRDGVRWHDGVPLTSRDVAFSWRAIVSPRNNVLHREGYDQVARVDTPDDRTVVVRLKRRDPPFVTQFFTTLQEGAKPVVPEHLLRDAPEINDVPFNAHPVGTGPFRFVAWDRGRRITLAANEQYFKGRPKLERVELSILPDINTIVTALRTHEVDMPVSADPLVYDRFRTAPGVRATLTDWNSQEILLLDDERPALRHVEVRRAIARAIDYGVLIDKLWFRTALPAHDVVPPACANFAPKGENESRTCDPVIDTLERAGLATDDPRERAEIYRTIGRRVHDTVPFIPLFRRRRVSVYNDDLRGYDPAPVAAPWWNAYAWSI